MRESHALFVLDALLQQKYSIDGPNHPNIDGLLEAVETARDPGEIQQFRGTIGDYLINRRRVYYDLNNLENWAQQESPKIDTDQKKNWSKSHIYSKLGRIIGYSGVATGGVGLGVGFEPGAVIGLAISLTGAAAYYHFKDKAQELENQDEIKKYILDITNLYGSQRFFTENNSDRFTDRIDVFLITSCRLISLMDLRDMDDMSIYGLLVAENKQVTNFQKNLKHIIKAIDCGKQYPGSEYGLSRENLSLQRHFLVETTFEADFEILNEVKRELAERPQ